MISIFIEKSSLFKHKRVFFILVRAFFVLVRVRPRHFFYYQSLHLRNYNFRVQASFFIFLAAPYLGCGRIRILTAILWPTKRSAQHYLPNLQFPILEPLNTFLSSACRAVYTKLFVFHGMYTKRCKTALQKTFRFLNCN